MTNYFLELAGAHIVLFIGYCLLIRKEKQYAYMRFYLLIGTLFSILIPFLEFPRLFGSHVETTTAIPQIIAVPESITYTIAQGSTSEISIYWCIYGIVSTFLLIRFLSGIVYLTRLKRESLNYKQGNAVIISPKNLNGSFSFFNWIFINRDESSVSVDVLLKHEKAHVYYKHTYDLLFLEFFRIIFWWLPTAWMTHSELKKIHEFQADAFVLRTENINDYSSILILSTLNSNGLAMTSPFNNGLTLKRIKEMKQQKRNIKIWKSGLLFSIIASLFVLLACTEDKTYSDKSVSIQNADRETFTIVEEQPSFDGGFDAFYRYVMSEIRYPKKARINGIEGRVFAQFVVERDGSITGVQTAKGIFAECDKEVERVLKNAPPFKPGSQRGRTVRVKMMLPVTFELNKSELNADNSPKGSVAVGQLDMKNGLLDVKAKYYKGKWSGKILSPEGDALPGVNIVLEGTEYGTVSDLDGTFSIEAKKSQALHISFVGYESVRLTNQY